MKYENMDTHSRDVQLRLYAETLGRIAKNFSKESDEQSLLKLSAFALQFVLFHHAKDFDSFISEMRRSLTAVEEAHIAKIIQDI